MLPTALPRNVRQRRHGRSGLIDEIPSWSQLRMVILTATFEAGQDCRLPPYKGSTLRGAFGHSLKAISSHNDDAGGCGMCERQRCAYGYIFEDTPSKSGRNPVLPLVITPPLDDRELYVEGDSITMKMTLIGDAISWVPTVVWALGRMGWQGLGYGKSPWNLADVRASTTTGATCSLIESFEEVPVVTGQDIVSAWPAFDHCELHFQTPVCVRQNGNTLTDLDAATLIRRINGRLGDLMETFSGIEANVFDMRTMNEAAEQIVVEDSRFEPKSWERFSTRSQQRHRIEGIVGMLKLSQIPLGLNALMVLGQYLHVGKSAAFGMGNYELVVQN